MNKFFLSLALCLISSNVAMAAPNWDTLAPADFIHSMNKVTNKESKNLRVEMTNVGYVFKKENDTTPSYYAGSSVIGSFYNTSNAQSLNVSSTTVTFEAGAKKPKTMYSMAVISNGTDIYFKPDGLKNKQMRNKWIKANAGHYQDIGAGLGVSQLFDVFDSSTQAEMESKANKFVAAFRKTNFWKKYDQEIDDGREVKNATRYNFELNQDAIYPFFKELTKTLTLEEAGYSLYADKNILKTLDDDSVKAFMADKSYMSVWIDNKTKKPVYIVEAFWTPLVEKKKTVYILQLSETKLSGYDNQPTLKLPVESVDAALASKQLKVKLGS